MDLPKIPALDWTVKKVSCFLYGFLNFYSFSWQGQKLRREGQISKCKNYPTRNLLCCAFGGIECSKPVVSGCCPPVL